MRKRLALLGAVLALGALVTTLMVGAASGGRDQGGPILIGISAAKTGILAPYDLQAGQLFQMRIEQINKAGGVLGRQDQSPVDRHEVGQADGGDERRGADLARAPSRSSPPATSTSRSRRSRRQRTKKVPGIALCASSPKVATPAIVGHYGGSMGLGSDTEGAAMAEWFRDEQAGPEARVHRQGHVARVLEGDGGLLQGPLEAARRRRSAARTPSSAAPNLDLSSQITRLRGKVNEL